MTASRPVVVITGASAGVGRATAAAFGARGASLALIARGEAGLDAAVRDVEAAGGRALAFRLDVADPVALEEAATAVEAELGPIDIWVNNAMTSVFSRFGEMTADEFRRVTEVTYLGVVWGTMAALRRMVPRNRGHVIQVGSGVAHRGIPLQSAYSGAKFAIRGFTESVRTELIHDGVDIRLSMVQLPALNTPQFDWVRSRLPGRAQPVPPVFQPELAAEAILFVADHPRRELLVGGPTVAAVRLSALAPGLLDRYLAATGVEAQQAEEPETPGRPDNLFAPQDDLVDAGAHGRFDRRAARRSWQFTLATHRGAVAAFLAVASAGAILARRNRSGPRLR